MEHQSKHCCPNRSLRLHRPCQTSPSFSGYWCHQPTERFLRYKSGSPRHGQTLAPEMRTQVSPIFHKPQRSHQGQSLNSILLPSKKERLVQLAKWFTPFLVLYIQDFIKPILSNLSIRRNAIPTGLTQSLYYIYKIPLNLISKTVIHCSRNAARGLLRSL